MSDCNFKAPTLSPFFVPFQRKPNRETSVFEKNRLTFFELLSSFFYGKVENYFWSRFTQHNPEVSVLNNILLEMPTSNALKTLSYIICYFKKSASNTTRSVTILEEADMQSASLSGTRLRTHHSKRSRKREDRTNTRHDVSTLLMRFSRCHRQGKT